MKKYYVWRREEDGSVVNCAYYYADKVEIGPAGELVFFDGNQLVAAFSNGSWDKCEVEQ